MASIYGLLHIIVIRKGVIQRHLYLIRRLN